MKKLYLMPLLAIFNTGIGFAQEQLPNCTDIFITEYIDGNIKNKSIEIFNPTNQDIPLNTYSLQIFENGSYTPKSVFLTDTIKSLKTYVVSNVLSDQDILLKTNQTDEKLFFNGNDAIVLMKGQTTVLDKIGEVGVNPGVNGWTAPNVSTKGHTLTRKIPVQNGETDWGVCSGEWNCFPVPYTPNLGQHVNECSAQILGNVNFTYSQSSYDEYDPFNGPSHFLEIEITTAPISDVVVGITGNSIWCNEFQTANLLDYELLDNLITFPSNSSSNQFAEFTITDDLEIEGDEYICFEIYSNNSNYPEGQNFSHQVEIRRNDAFGINDYEKENKFQITPSLAMNKIVLNWGSTLLKGVNISISIFDLGGRNVLDEKSFSGNSKTIDISELSPGLHNITIIDDFGNIGSSKFIKR